MFVLATQQINKRIAGRLLKSSFSSVYFFFFSCQMEPLMINPLTCGSIMSRSLNCLFMIHADDDCLPACFHMRTGRSQNYSKKSIDARKKVSIIGYVSNHSFFTGYRRSRGEFLLGKRAGAS